MKTTPTQEEKRILIAREQGWTVSAHGWWSHPTLPDNGGAMTDPPGYDYDANAALTLCDALAKEGWRYTIEDGVVCRFYRGDPKAHGYTEHEATAPTLAAAICESYARVKSLW